MTVCSLLPDMLLSVPSLDDKSLLDEGASYVVSI
jgi:hypothetical protein